MIFILDRPDRFGQKSVTLDSDEVLNAYPQFLGITTYIIKLRKSASSIRVGDDLNGSKVIEIIK